MNIVDLFSTKSRPLLTTIGLALVLLVGVVDYLTGYEFRMDLFYLVPISFAAWFIGRNGAVLLSLTALAVISLSDALSGKVYGRLALELWNVSITFGFYVIVALLVSRLHAIMQERSDLIEELQKTLGEVKELRGILPICSSCKRIRTDEGYWQNVDEYISRHTKAEFSHGICRDCAMRLYPDYYRNGNEEGSKGSR